MGLIYYISEMKNLIFLFTFLVFLSFLPLITVAQESNFNTKAELVFIDSSRYLLPFMDNTEATLLLLFKNKPTADTCLNYFVAVFQQNILETQQSLEVGNEYDLDVIVVPNNTSKIDTDLGGNKKRAVCVRTVLSDPRWDYENYFRIINIK